MPRLLLIAALLSAAGAAVAYQTPPGRAVAVATLDPVGRSGASGTVRLEAVEGGVRVLARLEGVRPDGRHGLRVLADTSCANASDPAAPHFDPHGAPHGSTYARADARHAGDLGNVLVRDGYARYDRVDPVLRLDGAASALGRVVVVTAGTDDLHSPPAGHAGPALACGRLEEAR